MSLGATVVDLGDKTSPGEQRDNSRVEFQNIGNYKNNPKKCLNCGKKDMSGPTRDNYSRYKFSKRKNARIKCWTCGGPQRQSECEKPPTCIRCGETGHKARYCLAPAPINQPQENF